MARFLPLTFLASIASLFGIVWIVWEFDPDTKPWMIFALFAVLLFVFSWSGLGTILYFLRTKFLRKYSADWYFKTSFKTRSSVRGSGSGNTANAKFCPAKGFNAVLNSACCFGDRERGCLNFSKASAASEAAFSAVAVRSFCLESSVSTPAMCSSLAFKSNVNCLSLAFSNSDWASAACEVLRIAKRVVSTIKTAARAAKASPHSIALFQKSADAESCATLDARASISDTCSPSDDVALSLIALSCVAIVVIVAWPWGRKL